MSSGKWRQFFLSLNVLNQYKIACGQNEEGDDHDIFVLFTLSIYAFTHDYHSLYSIFEEWTYISRALNIYRMIFSE